jgi:RluA family pseudouridine synthase
MHIGSETHARLYRKPRARLAPGRQLSMLAAMSLAPEILFEDTDLIAVNKPSGLLTEGGGEREDDLEQVATRHCGKPVRCCHRLDRATSGVILLRKTARFNTALAELFASHRVRKFYWAIVEGAWPSGVTKVETQIAAAGPGRFAKVRAGGKPAASTFRVLGHAPDHAHTWLGVLLKTGRTHQARLHCAHAGCPITGDTVYGGGSAEFFGLHARELQLRHPGTGADLTFTAPPPANWPDWAI